MSFWQRVLQKDSVEHYIQGDQKLTPFLDGKDLVLMGVGAVIGTGIFIIPGTVSATTTGPAIVISFFLAAALCSLAGMAYSELTSAMPVAGSAYTYGHILYGEGIGWLLGWVLVLEYILAIAAVATGWSAYFSFFVKPFFTMPTAINGAFDPGHGSFINLPAVVIILLVGWLMLRGKQVSRRVQDIMVLMKIGIILLFIVVGFFYIKSANYTPFIPPRAHGAFGVQGIFAGTALVFYSFLGFDSISSSAAEVKNVKRNMPIGIFGTLAVVVILFSLVGFVLNGMVNYTHLNISDPIAYALNLVGQPVVAYMITIGALVGMFTSLTAMTFAGSRLIYAMGRDCLLPPALGKVDDKTGLPKNALITVVICIAAVARVVPLGELTSLVNIGTLLAFVFVSGGIILLRRNKKIVNNGYKMPLVPLLPIISAGFSIYLITQLQKTTLIASAIWFVIGIIVYLLYGIKHSRMNDLPSPVNGIRSRNDELTEPLN